MLVFDYVLLHSGVNGKCIMRIIIIIETLYRDTEVYQYFLTYLK